MEFCAATSFSGDEMRFIIVVFDIAYGTVRFSCGLKIRCKMCCLSAYIEDLSVTNWPVRHDYCSSGVSEIASIFPDSETPASEFVAFGQI